MDIGKSIKKFFDNMNAKGIAVPLLRDSVTGKPSVTFSMFYICSIISILGLLGKFANLFNTVDLESAKELVIVFGSIYCGRSIIRGNLTSEKTDGGVKQDEQK